MFGLENMQSSLAIDKLKKMGFELKFDKNNEKNLAVGKIAMGDLLQFLEQTNEKFDTNLLDQEDVKDLLKLINKKVIKTPSADFTTDVATVILHKLNA